jgi:hypothetical protein
MAASVTEPQLEALTKKQIKNLPVKFTNALSPDKRTALTAPAEG